MWVYQHNCFHRDQPALLDKLRRKTSSGTHARPFYNPQVRS